MIQVKLYFKFTHFLSNLIFSDAFLDNNKPLCEQSLGESILFKKRFFINDDKVIQYSKFSCHLLFCEYTERVVNNHYFVEQNEAIEFASLHLQVTYGPYQAEKEKLFDFKNFAPEPYRTENCKQLVIKSWESLGEMIGDDAQYKYLHLCQKLKYFGSTFYQALDIERNENILFGISKNQFFLLNLENKSEIENLALMSVKKFNKLENQLRIEFGPSRNTLQLQSENVSEMFSLISGYLEFLIIKENYID